MKKVFAILGVNLLILFVFLLLLELVARLVWEDKFLRDGNPYLFFKFDSELGWVGVPNAEGFFKRGEDFDIWVSTNSRGMRDSEYMLEKRPGIIRIAVLGDSFAWGFGVTNRDNFPKILERELQDFGPGFEVLNFGMSGYGRGQQLLQFKREVLPFSPDAVIIMAYPGNDLYDNLADDPRLEIYPRPRFAVGKEGELKIEGLPLSPPQGDFSERYFITQTAQWMRYYTRSYLFRILFQEFVSLKKAWELEPSDFLNPVFRVDQLDRMTKQAKVEETILRDFRKLLDERGIKALYVVATTPEQANPELRDSIERKFPTIKVDWDQPSRLLIEAAKKNGYDVINLRPIMEEEENHGHPVHFNHDIHWNVMGNRVAALTLVPWARSLPASP